MFPPLVARCYSMTLYVYVSQIVSRYHMFPQIGNRYRVFPQIVNRVLPNRLSLPCHISPNSYHSSGEHQSYMYPVTPAHSILQMLVSKNLRD